MRAIQLENAIFKKSFNTQTKNTENKISIQWNVVKRIISWHNMTSQLNNPTKLQTKNTEF